MNGWVTAIVWTLVAAGPVGTGHVVAWADRHDRAVRRRLLSLAGAGSVLLAAAVVATGPLLDALDVSVHTFRLAASLVVGLTAARRVLVVDHPVQAVTAHEDAAVITMGRFAAPGVVFAAMAGGAHAGTGAGLVAVAITGSVVAAVLVAPRPSDGIGAIGARLGAAVALVLAVAVGLDSVRNV